MEREKIINGLYSVIEDINTLRPPDSQLEKSEETVLLGREAQLDSLALVNFIVAVEEMLEDDFELSLFSLANEKAMSRKNSPFKSIRSLADYICERIKED